jgi:hypothetical protein
MVSRVFTFGAPQSLVICVIVSEVSTASIVPAVENNDRAFRTWYAFGLHLHIVKPTGKAGSTSGRREPKKRDPQPAQGNWLRLALDLCLASL